MLITAFDSGAQTGWAQSTDGLVHKCGLVHVRDNRAIEGLPEQGHGTVIIEKPIHRREGKTVDPNDLIKLGIRVGRLVETYLVFENEIITVLPSTWKGGTPKEIQNDRDWNKGLTGQERALLGPLLTQVAAGYRNNVLDAIGILLWHLKRKGLR